MGFEDAIEKPGFWLLGAGGSIAVVLGWIFSKNMANTLPVWQFLIILAVVWAASFFFAARD